MRYPLRILLAGLLALSTAPLPAKSAGRAAVETPMLAERVANGDLPPVAQRLPQIPLIVDLEGRGRTLGRQGGEVMTLVSRARDIRYMSAMSYSRVVGYTEKLELKPDLVERMDVVEDRIFTFTIREGHKWSDGHPFTAEDFRYWWEDVANRKELSPSGPPVFMMAGGKPPRFEVLDERTFRYTWDEPNPRFLPAIAGPRDPFIYRPAHYLKQFHAAYGNATELDVQARGLKLKSWAAMHNRLDDMFENSNPELPTLQAWRITNAAPATRFVFERNPFYHRVDSAGRQLPYIDQVIYDVASSGLMAAKGNAGEVDLLVRGLNMSDVPILKEGETSKNYKTLLWPMARGSEIALYPNLNTVDPVWRKLNRDVRFRRALSMAIDRRTLNNALLFGLGTEGNNTVREGSALFEPDLRSRHATYNPREAARLLDEIGLTQRDSNDVRLLPDGRVLEIVVEVDGESAMLTDAMQLISEFCREIGIKIFVKAQERSILNNRSFAGLTVMVAAQGLDNAIPTAQMPPVELAPVRQSHYAFPKWGQYVETHGKSGESVDMPEAQRLIDLFERWNTSGDEEEQADIWRELLQNHAENQWTIGTVAGAIQPIVKRNGLENLPKKALYSWEPTSMLGVYRMDEIYWSDPARRGEPIRGTPVEGTPAR